jgi:Outer membrane lipoprotein-sorting protein
VRLGAVALAASFFSAIACPLLPAQAPAPHAPDAQSLIAMARERVQAVDLRATGHLVRVDASGSRTSYGITIKARWFPGVLRVVVEIAPPSSAKPDARAHILLEMRPNGQDSIQIAHPGDKALSPLPFEKWSDGPLGTGFSYEDFLEQQYFWPGQTPLEAVKYGARDCDVFTSTPGPADRTHYAGIKTWLDHSIAFPVYVEKTLRGSGEVKEFTYLGLRHDEGVWSASQVEEKTRGQAGSTLLIIDHGSAKAHLDLRDFSPEQLTSF